MAAAAVAFAARADRQTDSHQTGQGRESLRPMGFLQAEPEWESERQWIVVRLARGLRDQSPTDNATTAQHGNHFVPFMAWPPGEIVPRKNGQPTGTQMVADSPRAGLTIPAGQP